MTLFHEKIRGLVCGFPGLAEMLDRALGDQGLVPDAQPTHNRWCMYRSADLDNRHPLSCFSGDGLGA